MVQIQAARPEGAPQLGAGGCSGVPSQFAGALVNPSIEGVQARRVGSVVLGSGWGQGAVSRTVFRIERENSGIAR